MNKKEYMAPEMELVEMELESALMGLSTDNGDYDSGDIEDI